MNIKTWKLWLFLSRSHHKKNTESNKDVVHDIDLKRMDIDLKNLKVIITCSLENIPSRRT